MLLEGAWLKMELPSRSNFLPPACRIAMFGLEAPHDHMLKVPDKDFAYLNMGLAAWKGGWEQGRRSYLWAWKENTACRGRDRQPFRPVSEKSFIIVP